jgi:hypothetical protein
MSLRVNYIINRLQEVSLTNWKLRRHKDSPFKGVKYVKNYDLKTMVDEVHKTV